MQQVNDFIAECDALGALVDGLGDADWQARTQFKGWTVNDVFVHLTFWNDAVNRSLKNPETFAAALAAMKADLPAIGMRGHENAAISERGAALFCRWQGSCAQIGRDWHGIDPKTRIAWVGPSMSARSAIAARQMETWAHGQEVFDLQGKTRQEADRIGNIVILGVNTFGFAHERLRLPVPTQVPRIRLTAPSGAIWEHGDPASPDLIEGEAVEFAQVQAQTRSVADTSLKILGPVATQWMAIAQCFAGPPETPPARGSRFRAGAD